MLNPVAVSLAAVIVALVAAYIAWQQWWVNREKLRLDLFDRRYAVYRVAHRFASSVTQQGAVNGEEQQTFWIESLPAQFLFGDDINEYIEEIYEQASQLHYHTVSQQSHDADRVSHIEKASALVLWFAEQLREGMVKRFRPYLGFQGPRNRLWPF